MAREVKFDEDETIGLVETVVGQTIEKREAAKALDLAATREHSIRLFNRVLILLAILGGLFLVFREQNLRYQVEAAKIQIEAGGGGPSKGGPQ
jgi:hypothetical protein